MLAFVFDKTWRALNARDVTEIASPASAWGEDPLYRTYETETRDNISPGQLLEMLDPYARSAQFGDDYPSLIQTEVSSDTFNVSQGQTLPSDVETLDPRAAHLICVRPSFDRELKLWYVDIDPGDRNRWFRFELSRYQQFALPGYHLAKEKVFVNFFSTRSTVVTTSKTIDVLEITLDTVPYSGATLDDSVPPAEGRYTLELLEQVDPEVYFPRAQQQLSPQAFKVDRGSVRYVWKLPVSEQRQVAIRDVFKESVLTIVDPSAVQ